LTSRLCGATSVNVNILINPLIKITVLVAHRLEKAPAIKMKNRNRIAIISKFALVIALVVGLSTVSVSFWGGKSGKIMDIPELVIDRTMTLSQFGKINNLANPVLKSVFRLQSKSDLQNKLGEYNLTDDQIRKKVEGAAALNAEEESKDWMIFGIVLGSDPSAMGTVKDAITLYASRGVIFPPRMVALTVFLLMVLIANKFICSWGCQAGVLQDLIFRLNRDEKDTKGIIRQYKPAFLVTNTFRFLFVGLFTLAAVLWSVDIIEFVDPFKIYKPAAMGVLGIGFVVLLLTASLFVYRPWCHLFCPFGLVGWLVEKVSIFKIRVNYDSCISCEACAKACPSTVMNAILKQENMVPDCFACANCIDVCPTDSVSLASGKREKPPAGKFGVMESGG
jgi:Pyruvate/2-oxoacid:ferredoxin oxidoreductase delta subunit